MTNFGYSIPAGSTIAGIVARPKVAFNGAGPGFVLTLLKSGKPVDTPMVASIPAEAPEADTLLLVSAGLGLVSCTGWQHRTIARKKKL